MNRRKIYIAGPMTSKPGFNYRTFDRAAMLLRLEGWDVKNPTEIGASFGTPEAINADPALLAAVLAAELRAVEECDAVLLLNGWEKSKGAKKELAVALANGLEIVTEDAWLRQKPTALLIYRMGDEK